MKWEDIDWKLRFDYIDAIAIGVWTGLVLILWLLAQ